MSSNSVQSNYVGHSRGGNMISVAAILNHGAPNSGSAFTFHTSK